jgi:hypothetical protein
MPNGQNNGQTNTAEATLDLCYLMRDLEILASELLVAEEAEGRPVGTHQAPLSDRLSCIGVGDLKIENFSAWRHTLSGLIGSNSRDDDHLAQIAAVEKSGLIVLAELIEDLRTRDRQTKASNVRVTALAA